MNSTADVNRFQFWKSKLKIFFLEKHNGVIGLFQNKKYFSILVKSVLGIGCLVLLSYVFDHLTKTTQATTALEHKNQIIQRQIHELDTQISDLAKSTASAGHEADEEKIRQDILALQKNMMSLASTSDVSKLAHGLNNMKNQIGEIKKTIDHQNGQLPVSALPFEVQSMDVLDGSAYLVLLQHNRLLTVKAGDSVGEWTVLDISQNEKNATFQNAAGEQVIVHLGK